MSISPPPAPYDSLDALFQAIEAHYDSLSKRLQSIARQLPQHRDQIALMNVNDLAAALSVPPSSLVRFAQSMGFKGYSQMKGLFQQQLAEQIAINDNYAERIRHLAEEQRRAADSIPGSSMVREVVDNNIRSLQHIFSSKLMKALNRAVDMMEQADALWIMAAGRSFAAAAYLTYLTRHSDKPVHWLNGLCFNLDGQLNAVTRNDVVVVISFAPYAEASCKTVELAHRQGARIIALTDSHLSDIARHATQTIEIREHSSFGFRSLVSTVCVVQSLFLLYASRTELTKTEPLH
ncbi:MAG: MurR/RpiR family transcriptional regulator [Lautropia sp.]|nr:MurR/RpiR family transcriptional regulator [Lautropia sp.]